MPVQTRGEVLTVRRTGAYTAMTVVAPGLAREFRPGQFVAVAVGDGETPMLLRRAFSIYGTSDRGVYGGTVEFVFAVAGRGTEWLSRRRPHDLVDVDGPLGKPFALPKEPATCLLIGGGYGAAPLFPLAQALLARGCRVDFVLGAASEDRLFGTLDAKRAGTTLTVTTDDGSVGVRGWVSDVMPEVLERSRAQAVYACGPMGMLRSVAHLGADAGLPVQVAVEESMACGVGVCMTCVLPVVGADGVTRMVRSCVEGPVFRGERVRFDDVGTVPADALGAPPVEPAAPAAAAVTAATGQARSDAGARR